MAEKLIDAEAFKLEISKMCFKKCPEGNYKGNCGDCEIYLFAKKIENAPAIETKPVVHAHWKLIFIPCSLPAEDDYEEVACRCSKCGFPSDFESNYCPNCGAQMSEEVKIPVISMEDVTKKCKGDGEMTSREKLVELIRNAKKYTKEANCDLERDMIFADCLLENGVIVPPLKLGDTVYWHNGCGVITEYTIKAMQYTFDGKRKVWRLDLGDAFMPIYPCHGLFLTREEAEKEKKKQMEAFYKDMKERAEKDLERAEKALSEQESD